MNICNGNINIILVVIIFLFLCKKVYYKKIKNHLSNLSDNKPPERPYQGRYPLNEKTRGEFDYHLLGILYNENVNIKYQLYGRKENSNQYDYYIIGADQGGLKYKFPLGLSNEIVDNSQIKLPIDKNNYKVKIYDYAELRYTPYI